MANIRTPGAPRATDDTRGPNAPMTIDPGFDDPFRNPAGDVGSPRDYAGKRRDKLPDPYGYPVSPRR
jgi:hypothetical protein